MLGRHAGFEVRYGGGKAQSFGGANGRQRESRATARATILTSHGAKAATRWSGTFRGVERWLLVAWSLGGNVGRIHLLEVSPSFRR